MNYRLDLQNRRDRIDDARRAVNNARNDLLADLDLSADISIPTDDEKDRAGLDFDFEDLSFRAALALGLPIDREIERLNLRQAQVDLERSIREYERFRDTIAVDVRAAVRNIDRAEFSRQLQEQNVRTADRRLASINAAPDRADARDRSETADALLDAQNDYLRARRDVQVSILRYLLDSGQLRVNPDGSIRPLRDMPLHYGDPAESRASNNDGGRTGRADQVQNPLDPPPSVSYASFGGARWVYARSPPMKTQTSTERHS
jgi:outer membrane protein TolC